jgi:hypothetical protein
VLDIQPVMSYFAPLRQLIIHPCIQYACFSSNCPIFECFVFILWYEKKKLKFAYNGVVVQSCYSVFYHVIQNVKRCEFHDLSHSFFRYLYYAYLLALNWLKFNGIVRQDAPLHLVNARAGWNTRAIELPAGRGKCIQKALGQLEWRRHACKRAFKGIFSGPTYPVDVNGPFWSVCVEGRIYFALRSGPPSRRTQRADISCSAQVFLIIWN